MTKKGPISNVEKFYLDGHINDDPEVLAKEIDRTVYFVKKYINENINTKSNITSVRKEKVLKDHFAKRSGTVVMTEAASESGDDNRKTVKAQPEKDYIVKIKQ